MKEIKNPKDLNEKAVLLKTQTISMVLTSKEKCQILT